MIDQKPGSARTLPFGSELPRKSVVRIRPSSRWRTVNLPDLWEYRELFLFLVWRDLKVRYKQTLLGVGWVVLQPLLTMAVFALFFGRVVGVPSDGVPYPLFAFTGLVPWTFFSASVLRSGGSLVNSAHLLTKVYFPRLIIPGASVVSGLADFAIGLALLALMMVFYGIGVTPKLLLLPVLVTLTGLLALGIGMWTAALNVRYRDVGQILPFAVQLTMFASPIIYPASILPERWRGLYMLNPMAGIVEGYRAALLGAPLPVEALALATAMTLAVLVVAAYVFRSLEKDFADVV